MQGFMSRNWTYSRIHFNLTLGNVQGQNEWLQRIVIIKVYSLVINETAILVLM